MTLSHGEQWGMPGLLPPDAPVANSDAELAELVQAAGVGGGLVVALAGGDLCRTLGGRGDAAERLGQQTTLARLDIGVAVLDDQPGRLFAAHLQARGRLWSGPCLVAMNAQWLNQWQLAPRSHPGDGLLDFVSGHLGLSQRILAGRKAMRGEHLPHPDLAVSRKATRTESFARSRRVYLDGRFVRSCTRITVTLNPNAVSVAV